MKNQLENQFVTFEIAKKLKEFGFNEKCFGLYNSIKELCYPQLHCGEWKSFYEQEEQRWITNAPLYQQVVDWLRGKGIVIEVWADITGLEDEYMFNIFIKDKKGFSSDWFKSYYEALNNAISQALELIK